MGSQAYSADRCGMSISSLQLSQLRGPQLLSPQDEVSDHKQVENEGFSGQAAQSEMKVE